MVDLNRSDPLFDAQLPIRIRDQRPSKSSSGTGVDYIFTPVFVSQFFAYCCEAGRRGEFAEDESLRYLTIRLLTGSRHSNNNSSSTIRERLLHIEITDEQEPYFLYTLDVGEDDFHELKKDQVCERRLLFVELHSLSVGAHKTSLYFFYLCVKIYLVMSIPQASPTSRVSHVSPSLSLSPHTNAFVSSPCS
jgi:hypothetical protein